MSRPTTNSLPARPWRPFGRPGFGLLAAAALVWLAGCRRPSPPSEPRPVSAPAPPAARATNAASRFQAVTFNRRSQKSALLTSEDVASLPDGRPVLIRPHLTTYRDDGSVAWIAEPVECVYDDQDHLAWSPKDFHAYTADRRFDIRGRGFQLRLEETHLFISNAVQTLIHRPPPTNAPAAAEAPVEVSSDQFD
ncbi:MAG: hypothetical protein KGS61_05410, partial [Verrucomicrobia bacterium]|nr:hypothetical protein [Verrucomicrobiota bacterium]